MQSYKFTICTEKNDYMISYESNVNLIPNRYIYIVKA